MGLSILEARNTVEQGEPLSRGLERKEGIPLLVVRMVAAGERSGKLDDMLGQRTSWDTAAFTQLVQASYIVDAPWSSGELSKLKAQAAMGLPLEAMARALDRTRESVQSKLTELGLKASF